MKNLTLICLLFMLFVNSAYSQYNCATAFHDGFMDTIPLPPVGTMAPAGPDYGSLDILSRPIWGFLTSCDTSLFINIGFDKPANQNSFTSIIIWGPFYSKNDACNNLTSANIYAVRDSVSNQWGGPDIIYSFTSGIQEIYIYMLTTDDVTPIVDYKSFTWYPLQPIGSVDNLCFLCNDKVSVMIHKRACMITFDTTSQNTKLIWEKDYNSGIGGNIIYRAATISSIMDSIGFVPENVPSEFIDYDSHALQYAEHYRLVPVDSCGNRYTTFNYYYNTSGFLQTYPSGNNTVNLNWNGFGVAQLTVSYEPVLYIHRGTSPQNMQIIDTIPYGVFNYTDNTAPPGQQFYAIEHRRFSPCDPLRVASSSSPYTSSMTNPSVATVTGIPVLNNENLIQVNPVPVIDELTVTIGVSLIGNKITLVDVNGKVLSNELLKNTNHTIDVSALASGTYWLSITGREKIVKKIIIGR